MLAGLLLPDGAHAGVGVGSASEPGFGHRVVSPQLCDPSPSSIGHESTAGIVEPQCGSGPNPGGLIPVTPNITTGAASGSVSPHATWYVDYGEQMVFHLTPASGYVIGSVSSACGDTGTHGTLAGNVYTTAPVIKACIVNFSFTPAPPVPHDDVYTVTTDPNYPFAYLNPLINDYLSAPGGTLKIVSITHPGRGSALIDTDTRFIDYYYDADATYDTAMTYTVEDQNGTRATANIVIHAVKPGTQTHAVTPSIGAGDGAISPAAAQNVADGGAATFTLAPASNYVVDSVGGTCGGTLTGNSFTTNPVTADCTVIANFKLAITHIVTPNLVITDANSAPNGTMSPNTPQTVNDGATATFTLTPNAGYKIYIAQGSCAGNLVGTTFTTNPVTADCTLTVQFVAIATNPTTTMLIATPNSAATGQAVTFTATVTATRGMGIESVSGASASLADAKGSVSPQFVSHPPGYVIFSEGGNQLAMVNLTLASPSPNETWGPATFVTSNLAPGTHTILATYPGTIYDETYGESLASVTVTINGQPVAPAVAAPALDRWALLLLAMALGGFVWRRRCGARRSIH